MKTLALFSLLAVAACVAPTASAASITNGGFETGDLTGWTVNTCSSPACAVQGWGVSNALPQSGTFAATTLCVDVACLNPITGDTLSQVPTGVVNGTSYAFSIGINPEQAGCSTCQIDIYWGGVLRASYVSLAAGYTNHALSLVGGAGNGSNILLIAGRHDPATMYIDNVSFGDSVPEPATFALAGLALAGLVFARRR